MSSVKIIFVSIILVAVSFFTPKFIFTFDISTILTVVSLLFVILIGFFFAAATSNYQRLQTLIAGANAGLVSVFSLSRAAQPGVEGNVADAIDKYMMAVLDHPLLEYVSYTEREFQAICEEIDKINAIDEKGLAILGYLHEKKSSILGYLHEMSLVSQPVVGVMHWVVLIIFSLIIALLMLALRDGTFVSSTITATVLVSIYLVLDILYAVDINLFLAKKLGFQFPQIVFRGINRLPYYPLYVIERKYVNTLPKMYRVGKYGKGGERIIEIIDKTK